ncbi:Phosphoribosylglycinamide formyltransferase [Trichoderma lentiforme]|uniref:Phosphoribosylglycinamide formyltransferase n=1 Tax=Trichoderma lentiforme TaxID=1567552 RepID=A0A9P4X2E4_9HYPO|nr:Phosphoribosylglycinamide formyltransferase [Trichoderma lentiforme]
MAEQDERCRILVMASGNGSNFQALIDGVASGSIPNSRITRLVVNRAKAYATTRAEKAGIPWEYFNLISNGFLAKGEKDEAKTAEARKKYDAALADKILALEERPQLIVLAGWMWVFSAEFLRPLEEVGILVINLHPALPGKFDGAHAIERAYEDLKAGKITHTGIMVHYVIQEVDRGEPILTQEIGWDGEELDALEAKIHAHEHELIVKASAKVVGEILEGRKK